jgi:hypothetical protein
MRIDGMLNYVRNKEYYVKDGRDKSKKLQRRRYWKNVLPRQRW